MKYIKYTLDGIITGLDNIPQETYKTCSDDVYDYVLQHGGLSYVLVDKAYERIKNNEEIIVTMNEISIERKFDVQLIIHTVKKKNYNYCKMYIEDGIIHNDKHYTFKLEDQVNYDEIMRLIDNNILTDTVPIKASEETEYEYLSINEFKSLYYKLLKNKYYNLFYLQELNDYVSTFTDEKLLHRLHYETALPKERMDIVNNKINNFDFLNFSEEGNS